MKNTENESQEEIAETIGRHGLDGRKSYMTAVCACGVWRGSRIEHKRHVAAMLLPLFTESLEQAANIRAVEKDIDCLIWDLELGRAGGTVYTYGYVQERLRHAAVILAHTVTSAP